MSRDIAAESARAFVDELVRGGVRIVALAPGSRSTPLALALADDSRLGVEVFLDERSAAGFALGAAKASDVPTVVCCTSGTAAAHFHWAVLEAHHARVPLLVCTADRPPELRGIGAGQTIDQTNLYGTAVRWFCDPGPPDERPGMDREWRTLAARALAVARGVPAGPVHLNLPFREPLVPAGAAPVFNVGRPGDVARVATQPETTHVDPDSAAALADAVRGTRGVLVAGWGADVVPATAARFARAAGWPVLADPLSGLRVGETISTYDALLRVEQFAAAHRPDVVVRVGAPLTSKAAMSWLDGADASWLVDPAGEWLDPHRSATVRVVAEAEALLAGAAELLAGDVGTPDAAWMDAWRSAESAARRALDAACDGSDEVFEGRVARDVAASLPDGATLFVASSMPVRDVEGFAAPHAGVRFLANRGTNGIDGFVSSVLGAAAASAGPVVGLLGDLCFLHDANGLLGVERRGLDATFVVVDNDGGGIFSFLPQAHSAAIPPDRFEQLFGTPQGVDLAALAALHGVPCDEVTTADALAPTLRTAMAAGGVRVVLVRTDRATNVERHEAAWAAVRVALS
jgi:2-succinyl-5-enolpyruvyl-6-hydroxy-3-cyclohexene-1-carboxylate synthase